MVNEANQQEYGKLLCHARGNENTRCDGLAPPSMRHLAQVIVPARKSITDPGQIF
jgi:hypothetical protein